MSSWCRVDDDDDDDFKDNFIGGREGGSGNKIGAARQSSSGYRLYCVESFA